MTTELKEFIEQNINLIEDNDFTELYNRCSDDNRGELTDVLYECSIDPLQYMTEIPDMFAAETDLTNITIPDSITSIGKHAFDECIKLTRVTISNNVKWIDKYAFGGCSSLTSITIPDSVTSIGNYAFSVCDSLISVTIPDSVTNIGKGAFISCDNLESVTIGSGLTNIGSSAFEDCGHIQIFYAGTTQEWKNLITDTNIFPYTTYVCNCSDGVVNKSR